MKRILLFATVALLLNGLVMSFQGYAQKPAADTKTEKPEMDQTMMAMHGAHHDELGPHMKMTSVRPRHPGDEQRAGVVAQTARRVLEKFQDYKVALTEGFQIFMPNVPQPMYHFTNYRYALEAETRFNPEHPTSLLYEKQGSGYQLIGAMYTAAAQLSEAELDGRIPLSIAQWHQHVNICFPPAERRAEALQPHARYGLRGSISTKGECEKAGGNFMPRLFGWMVHVYPFEKTSEKIWSLERQMQNETTLDLERSPAVLHVGDISAGGFSDPRLGPAKPGTRTPAVLTLDPESQELHSGIGVEFPINKNLRPAADATVRQSTGSLKSEGKDISFELFEPAAAGKYPTIVMLYGSGGMTVGGPLFRETAKALALQGYVVYLPHYFDKTGTERAAGADYVKYFAPWMRTIDDTIVYAKSRPNVDANRVGLIGFSLGAYLSLSVASVNSEIKTVVEYFGGLPDIFSKQLQTMPPTLILHGDADTAVPVAEAYKLETLLKSKNSIYEIKIYEGQGHGFTGAAAADAIQRTVAFLAKNLKTAGQ